MCIRAVLPPSLLHWGMGAVLSLTLGYARCGPFLSHVIEVSLTLGHTRYALLHWGTRTVFPLSRIQLCSLSLASGYARCVPSLSRM